MVRASSEILQSCFKPLHHEFDPLVKINYTAPALNTHSKKWALCKGFNIDLQQAEKETNDSSTSSHYPIIKTKTSANVLDINRLPELSITSSESINFSCYNMSEKVEWYLDSGSTEHITPEKSDFIQYREFGKPESTEVADGKFLTIEGYGTIIRHSIVMVQLHEVEIRELRHKYLVEVTKYEFYYLSRTPEVMIYHSRTLNDQRSKVHKGQESTYSGSENL